MLVYSDFITDNTFEKQAFHSCMDEIIKVKHSEFKFFLI